MKYLILITIILFAGCASSEKHPTKIIKIGERDNIIVYRFEDYGDYHYFVVYNNKAIMLPENKRPQPVELDQGNK